MTPPRSDSRSPWIGGLVAFAALWWLFDLAVLRSGVPDRLDDVWEYGVAARTLLEGHGFRTILIHPPLWTLRDSALTVPVLIHGPLLSLLFTPFVALLGAHALDGLAWFAALGAILVIPPLVRLGERCGSAAVGGAAALIWTVAPLTIHSVHHDVALTIGTALLVAALELATREAPRPFAAGVALGLACLARHEMLAGLPLLALAAGSGGWRLLLGAVLPLGPWWIHNAIAVGQPLFNLSSYLAIGYWGNRPSIGVLRDFSLPPARFGTTLAAWLPGNLDKWVAFFPHAVKRALLTPADSIGWLAPIGAAFALARPPRRVALLALAIALIPVVVMTVTLYDPRYVVPFLPLYALGAARAAYEIAARAPSWARRPRAWIGLLVLLLLPVTGPALREEAAHSARQREVLAREEAAIAAWSGRLARAEREAGVTEPLPVFSDTPDLVAWLTRRPTIWFTIEDLRQLSPAATAERPARPDTLHTWFHVPPPW